MALYAVPAVFAQSTAKAIDSLPIDSSLPPPMAQRDTTANVLLLPDAQDTASTDSAGQAALAPRVIGLVTLGVVLGQNVLVWSWDRFYLQKNYARINLHTMKTNMREGFDWDDNHYAINFFGHPYQGTFYYTAARSTGNGFYSSYLATLVGSFTWEMYMERERPSTNDLLVTSIGGATYGEVLFRLSSQLQDNPRHNLARELGSIALSPMARANQALFGKRIHYPSYRPLDFSLFMGGGYHFYSDYSYAEHDVREPSSSWKGRALGLGMSLDYGRPGRIVKAPFEYFTLRYDQLLDEQTTLLDFETMGVLKNYALHSGKNWIDLSLQLHYDVMYGDLVEMSANSLGANVDFNLYLKERLRMRFSNGGGYVFIGASDFNYEDALVAEDPSLKDEMRTYQLGRGFFFKNALELEWVGRGLFRSQTSVYGLYTMPGSEPHYGARGWDAVAKHDASVEAYLPWNLSLGYRADLYWKVAAYETFDPLARLMGTNWMYLRYTF